MIMIQMVDVDKIHPHPDNPRKQLGDIEELSNSIRENGIMQNLTVVPYFDEETKVPPADGSMAGHYRTIIGHRRCAAAKKAGVKQVPCVITEMDYPAQVQTMLLENMQRSDLTPFEQAEGFQMMMDLGSSVADIVKNTGFSESTVRHRLKLMDLDQQLLQEKSQQNINMFDLIKLEQIKDPEQKNKALEKIGTKEFNWTLQNILDSQIKEEKIAAFIEMFEPYVPIRRSYLGGATSIKSWNISNIELEDIKALDVEALCSDIEGKASLYITTYNWVELQRERDVEPEPENEEENEKRARKAEIEKERHAKLEDIRTKMYESRMRFVKHLPIKKAKENINNTIKMATMKIATDSLYTWDIDEPISEILDIDYEESETPDEDYENAVKQRSKKYPELALFQTVYCGMERQGKPWDYYYHYEKNVKLEELYQFLGVYGYEMSTEEQQIMDGTHELYQVEE